MFGLEQPKPVAEHEAKGEIGRVYHEIRQVLRVTGVNLNFRTWAGYGDFLPSLWDAMRPNLETRDFESASDRVRSQAAAEAEFWGRSKAGAQAQLGESQMFHVRAALDLYHFVNPKLLVLTAAVTCALDGESIGVASPASAPPERISLGAPRGMAPMEMESDEPDDPRLQELFREITQTLNLTTVNSDYRTLALWPDYLAAAWNQVKPIVRTDDHAKAADRLRQTARTQARQLPLPIPLTSETVERCGQNPDTIRKVTEQFLQLLPGLVLNIALLQHEWRSADDLARSPFPAETRTHRGGTPA